MLQFLIYLTYFLVLVYAVFLFFILKSWKLRTKNEISSISVPAPLVSVLVPARNEAKGIVACIKAILEQDYPFERMEVIVIDDHSTDDTASLVQQIKDNRVRLLQLEHLLERNEKIKSYKKIALTLGINQAKGDYIITTDADCIAPSNWLRSYAIAFQNQANMVLAPVEITGADNFLTAVQGLDVAGTMLLTGAAVFWQRPILSNGANFGFSKEVFNALNGYKGNEDQASGDDVFLLQKAVAQKLEDIVFLPQRAALVQTMGAQSWQALFWQRLRWAGKTSAYSDPFLIAFQASVFLLCALLISGVFACMLGAVEASYIAVAWLIKGATDWFYLRFATRTLGQETWMRWFLPALLAHTFYVVIIGGLALLPISGKWKGRKI